MITNNAQATSPPTAKDDLRELADQAVAFISRLPGPVSRVELARGDYRVEVEWALVQPTAPLAGQPGSAAPVTAHTLVGPTHDDSEPATNEYRVQVRAPLVGTFYQAPGPGLAPFVEVGHVVEPGQQLAIIEAMKLMNAINADCHGRVKAVHVQDGVPVEFDQPLFDLEPLDEA